MNGQTSNRQWILKSFPIGLPKPDDFEMIDRPIPSPSEGEVLLELHYLALDPGQRFLIDPENRAVSVGNVVPGWGLGRVVESRNASFPVGSFARDTMAQAGVQEYAAIHGDNLVPVSGKAPLPWYLGPLGMPGQTAYFGLLDVGQAETGETVVISGASGAVGSIAAQIAQIKGCRTIAIARTSEKASYLGNRLGIKLVISIDDPKFKLKFDELCPGGVDLFFDVVGGDILDSTLNHMKRKGRIVTAGMISTYNHTSRSTGLTNYDLVFRRNLTWSGFSVGDYASRYAEGTRALEEWSLSGKILFDTHIERGLETFPAMLRKLFTERRAGKLIIQLGEPHLGALE